MATHFRSGDISQRRIRPSALAAVTIGASATSSARVLFRPGDITQQQHRSGCDVGTTLKVGPTPKRRG
ncbi:hypothetical protein U9M48_018536 [Paspalum notatum var. saurae]|uniref:Uncharacterized protein n=1 Tax=Paspalum notatum var. saurae TaxID=547442 RepID=A0AAQ3WPV7_PASNO